MNRKARNQDRQVGRQTEARRHARQAGQQKREKIEKEINRQKSEKAG